MAGLMELLSGVGSATAGYNIAKDLRKVGAEAQTDLGTLAGNLQQDSGFRGYGVQTGLGQSTVDAQGNTNIGVGLDPAMMGMMNQYGSQGGQFDQYAGQAAQNAMMNTAAREQDIYNRAMAVQQPGLDQQRAQQQAREFAMGRGGVRGSQFGGSAEDAAMAKAQAEAMNAASFASMGQAQTEMMNQGQLASQFGQVGQGYGSLGMNAYQQAFTPLQQQLNAMQVGGQNADRFQTGQLTGTGYGAQLGLGGLQARINAEKAASEMYANLFGSGMNAIAGVAGGGNSGGGGLLGSIGDLAGGAIDFGSGLFDQYFGGSSNGNPTGYASLDEYF